ncbi:MAG TPA: tRNA (adenosine(37)-N6)-threonylcarbamoyltransferase complex dimerization subunit type 1 TsaB [Vicinamibacterales bacterium]|nr:tRNA (adenosine(37)-N6)-threonylcarbamoyltransferase complex dimerization subunit type 1 TsaB [Vicinamibacterales bacterium]
MVLSLDTTSRAGSAALIVDGVVRVQHSGDPALTHGQRLPGDLMQVLGRGGATPQQVDLLALAAGPGSFTGLRVGIAAMQGLAMALDRRVVPIPTLEALAHAAGSGEGPVGVWMDAQRGEVFAALYDEDARGLHMLVDGTALSPEDTIERWRDRLGAGPVRFIGDGAVRHASRLLPAVPAATIIDPAPPLAGVIGLLAAAAPARAVLPHAIVPVYIRRPDAELARDRRTGAR